MQNSHRQKGPRFLGALWLPLPVRGRQRVVFLGATPGRRPVLSLPAEHTGFQGVMARAWQDPRRTTIHRPACNGCVVGSDPGPRVLAHPGVMLCPEARGTYQAQTSLPMRLLGAVNHCPSLCASVCCGCLQGCTSALSLVIRMCAPMCPHAHGGGCACLARCWGLATPRWAGRVQAPLG